MGWRDKLGKYFATHPFNIDGAVTIAGVTAITGATDIVGATSITGALTQVGNVGVTGALTVSGAIVSTIEASMAPGVGFEGTGTLYYSSVVRQGDFKKTTIFIDLTGAASSTTDLDIIGTDGVSHIGQITAALNGTLFFGQVTCLETPAGGVDDIDFYSATEGTGAFDGGIAALAEAVMRTNAGSWTAAAATQIAFTNLPAANKYMYMTCGAAGTPATYTAGQFLIELWGV